MVNRTGADMIRVLSSADVDAALSLLRCDPAVNVAVDHRTRMTRLEPRWLGGRVWGRFQDGTLTSMLHVATNVMLAQADQEACRRYSDLILDQHLDFSTIVGPRRQVTWLWQGLEDDFPRPRDARWDQPHLELSTRPAIAPDPLVRVTPVDEVEVLYPACVAMYTEEVGVSPELDGGGAAYRARVAQLINRGWSFSRVEDGEVVFKAEVACASPSVAQVQGVYVHPDRRGEGLAAAAMAAVVELVRRDIAPTVSLYVNAHNVPARGAYARVGFEQTETFSTLMF